MIFLHTSVDIWQDCEEKQTNCVENVHSKLETSRKIKNYGEIGNHIMIAFDRN